MQSSETTLIFKFRYYDHRYDEEADFDDLFAADSRSEVRFLTFLYKKGQLFLNEKEIHLKKRSEFTSAEEQQHRTTWSSSDVSTSDNDALDQRYWNPIEGSNTDELDEPELVFRSALFYATAIQSKNLNKIIYHSNKVSVLIERLIWLLLHNDPRIHSYDLVTIDNYQAVSYNKKSWFRISSSRITWDVEDFVLDLINY
jgi:hypothetical protein